MGKSQNNKNLGTGIVQRKDGSYQARFIDRFGKRRSLYGRTITEVQKKLRDAKYEDDHLKNTVNINITLDDWYEKWLKISKKACRDTTRRTYEIQYNRLRKSIGWRKINTLNLILLQDAFNSLGSDKTRRDCKALLVDMLNRAVEADFLIKNPAIGIKTDIDGTTVSEKRILSAEETELLLESAKESTIYPILVVALNTGMRIGEILGLEWKNIHFDRHTIDVIQTLTYLPGDGLHACYELHKPKTPAGFRTIPMSKTVKDILLIQKERYGNINTHFEPLEGFEDLVFTSKTNKPLNASNIKDTLNRIIEKINADHPEQFFEHLTPHGLRHTFATNCIEKGMPPKVLQKILGHNSMQMTVDLYAHVREDKIREEMAKVMDMMPDSND